MSKKQKINVRDWSAHYPRPKPEGWSARKAKRFRELSGLSLRDVAKALGVSHPTVYGWEIGRCNPSEANAAKLRALYARAAP